MPIQIIPNLTKYLVIAFVVAMFTLPTIAATQSVTRSQERDIAQAVKKLKKEHPEAEVELSRSGLPESIDGVDLKLIEAKVTPERARNEVEAFIESNPKLFLLKNPVAESEIVGQVEDPAVPGRLLVRVQQKLDGIRILGAEAVFAVDPQDSTLSAETALHSTPDVATEAHITAQEAIALAVADYQHLLESIGGLKEEENQLQIDDTKSKPELIIVRPSEIGGELSTFRLAWRVEIGTFLFFIDALDGKKLARYRDHHTALSRKTYDLSNGNTFPGALVLQDPNQNATSGASLDAAHAHENARIAYEFFQGHFGRDGIDDVDGINGPRGGGVITSFVRVSNLNNALWSRKRGAMVYGPGFASALDVVAHELTHGIIINQVDLVYQGESGALSEFFADLFGALVEGNWEIGEDLPGFSPPERPLRNMADPHNGGFNSAMPPSSFNRGQPDHMSESVQRADKICASSLGSLNGCVHFNSGIWNKAAFLLTEGGEHKGITVIGIGKTKVAQIFYTTLLNLSSTSTFARAAEVSVTVCNDMQSHGSHGITKADCDQLLSSLRAVRLL